MSTGTTTLTDRKAKAWFWAALFSLMAFAANSVFCRLALKDRAIDPALFTVVRLASGALFLLLLIRLRKPALGIGGSWRGGLALFLYAFLFLRHTCGWVQVRGIAAVRRSADHHVRLCLVQR